MALPILRPLAVGEILDAAFTLYRRHFVTLAVTALIPTLGITAGFLLLGRGYVQAMTSADPMEVMTQAMTGLSRVMLIGFAGALVLWPALTRQVAQAYMGHPTSVADGFAAGARALLALLGASVLAWIGFIAAGIGVGIVLMVVVMILGVMGPVMGIVGLLVALLGWFAFILVAFAFLFAVVPAVVVEGAGPVVALERSFTLARGALRRVLGVLLVAGLIAYLPMMAVMALTGGFAQMMDPSDVPSAGQFVTQQVLSMGVGILTTPFLVAVVVLLYFDRRVRTEALDVRMMTDALAVAGD